jgi:outer membrane protein assembly factor BamB
MRYNLLRRTPAGTFLLAMRAEKAFIEIDETGKELWRHSVPDLPVVAERLANGNTLMSWRGGLLEVTPKHEVAWELKAADVKDFTVLIFGGFHRFENGNTLIANSDWHYRDAKETAVQLFEVTRDKKVVWKLGVEAFAGRKPGSLEPKTGNIEHRIIGIQWLGEDRK